MPEDVWDPEFGPPNPDDPFESAVGAMVTLYLLASALSPEGELITVSARQTGPIFTLRIGQGPEASAIMKAAEQAYQAMHKARENGS
jgi:hypothetical protein